MHPTFFPSLPRVPFTNTSEIPSSLPLLPLRLISWFISFLLCIQTSLLPFLSQIHAPFLPLFCSLYILFFYFISFLLCIPPLSFLPTLSLHRYKHPSFPSPSPPLLPHSIPSTSDNRPIVILFLHASLFSSLLSSLLQWPMQFYLHAHEPSSYLPFLISLLRYSFLV